MSNWMTKVGSLNIPVRYMIRYAIHFIAIQLTSYNVGVYVEGLDRTSACCSGGGPGGNRMGGPLSAKQYITGPNSCNCTAPIPILAMQGGTQVAYRYLSRCVLYSFLLTWAGSTAWRAPQSPSKELSFIKLESTRTRKKTTRVWNSKHWNCLQSIRLLGEEIQIWQL